MQDRYGREINYLRISVTDRCNFRCQYCIPEEGIELLPREEILSYEEILQIAQAAISVGINRFRITGGEPLVRKGIIRFMGQLKALPGVGKISLTTNGYLIKQYADELTRLGLNSINVGLNTIREDCFQKITGKSGIKIVWEGIKALAETGFPNLKINTVLLKGINEDEVIDFARLSLDYPLTVRFIEYMPCGSWEKNKDIIVAGEEIMNRLRDVFGELIPVDYSMGDGPARYFRLKDSQGILGFILPVSSPFCSKCNRLRLTPDGYLKSCLLSEETIEVKSILRQGRTDILPEAIKQAILNKPKEHLHRRENQMSRIGG